MVNKLNKIILSLLAMFVSFTFVSAAVNVIDVELTESVFQSITYNPLNTGSGIWYGAGENQSAYTLKGQVIVRNNHPTDSVQNVVINVSGIGNISNMVFDSGSTGIVSSFDVGNDFAILTIGDIGNGSSSIFNYTINETAIAPPINLTSSYNLNVFSGLSFNVNDSIINELNAIQYADNCIYDLQLVQGSEGLTQGADTLNFTYVGGSLGGSDSGNAVISSDNRTLSWNVSNNACVNSGDTQNIDYDVLSPTGVSNATSYTFINSTISYKLNTTISKLTVSSIAAITDLEIEFQKYQDAILTGDNATWQITSRILSESDITVNLTKVSLWVSKRNGTGTGFTNPALHDNDTISGAELLRNYNPNIFLNSTTGPWNNTGAEWLFNYTFSSSPIVWMDAENTVVDDAIQLTNRTITYGDNEIYIKEIYVATGYWLEINKNITRIADSEYNVLITVRNLGSSPTPSGQAVVVYNFIPILFNLTSPMVFSNSNWYNTDSANTTLNDPIYNGTMFQYGLLENGNPTQSSLNSFGLGSDENNTWTVTYNLSGDGEFNFDDLFLTGVDPLNIKEVGGTSTLSVEGVYKVLSSKAEYVLSGLAILIGILLLVF